ncbi:fungal-specific transcription factor domain-containing protein [Coprinopsis sp. MPI-PUGE-AT-0042]|nr:fungal-specific transcription factor domain-containing protein [Coprinopsis sp. MPI-PUGE-AT-0042]
MSSNDEDYENDGLSSTAQGQKKRRIQRACDICRRKKSDGAQMPGNRCSNCISFNFECTYVEVAKKRGPPKGYVESLENRLKKLESLLRTLCPDDNLLRELESSPDKSSIPIATPPESSNSIFTSKRSSPPHKPKPGDASDIVTTVLRNIDTELPPNFADDDNAHLILADNLKSLSIDAVDYRFFGKSSGAMLIQTAIELKNEFTGSDHDFRKAQSVLGAKRDEFWVQHPWEGRTTSTSKAQYIFPEDDLITHLVDLYFTKINLYLPLLHRPSFERSIGEGLHLTDDGFGGTLLLVCASGSRFSEDRRVLLDGEESFHSAGWKWFEQVHVVKKSLLTPPSLYDLQYYCLSVQFLQGSSAPQSCWTMVGIGIRLAQDVGAHRKRVNKSGPSADDELWKRAFWVLVCMDRTVSAALGRPCAIQDEDFDLDMPIECDDEYWDTECDDPSQAWVQPSGKPSLLTAFCLYLKLNQILAFSLRTIYSINKSKILLGFIGPKWEQHIVAELDSALNKWIDSIPYHLRWDPFREAEMFFNQSATLYCTLYHIQILIHRPFIPSPNNPSPLSFPSLAICTNAARSCSHIIDVQMQRFSYPMPHVQMPVFTAGIVLLLGIWGGKRSGLSTDPNKEMVDVHKCMKMLRNCERHWHSAGRLWDILYELASVGELPLPQPTPPSNKRERDSETPMSSPSTSSELPLTFESGSRPIAGSRRVQKDASFASRHLVPNAHSQHHLVNQRLHRPSSDSLRSTSSSSHQGSQPMIATQPQMPSSDHQRLHAPSEQHQQHQFFSLPVYSQDLGKLPVHGHLEFSAAEQPSYWYTSLQAGASHSQPAATTRSVAVSNSTGGASHFDSSVGPMSAPLSADFSRTSISQNRSNDDLPRYTSSVGRGPVGSGSITAFGGSPSYPVSGLASGGPRESPPGSAGSIQGYPARGPNVAAEAGAMLLGGGPPSQQGMPGSPFGVGSSSGAFGGANNGGVAPGAYQSVNQHQRHQEHGGQPYPSGYVDSDTMAMWSNAPTGFELDEWGYLSDECGSGFESVGPAAQGTLSFSDHNTNRDGRHLG